MTHHASRITHHEPRITHHASRFAFPVLILGLAGWLVWSGERAYRVQQAEEAVRTRIGLWLRENTPEHARVALEPIGYVGYYSQRRILDEVGLVSPEMVPLNREGAGWFWEMLHRFRPDYVVERPAYLLRNQTLNSRVPMFRSVAERDAFLLQYEAVATFGDASVPKHLRRDYCFVIYARRSARETWSWAERLAKLHPDDREVFQLRALTGPVAGPATPNHRTAREEAPLRQR